MIARYEKAVLEWFHRSYPQVRTMVYAEELDGFFAQERTYTYPSLFYSRKEIDWVLPKAMPVTGEVGDAEKNSVIFSATQEYEARLILNDETDLFRAANVLRQAFYRESYVTLRYPMENDQLRVGMRLIAFELATVRRKWDEKGPLRMLKMKWQSELLLEALYPVKRYTGFRVWINTPSGDRIKAFGNCAGDSCVIPNIP